MKRWWSKIWHALRDEKGNNSILVMAFLGGMLLVVPIIYDYASTYYARRVSQTGSDAAVMSAAQDYARALSIEWRGFCGEPAISVAERYAAFATMIGSSPIGAGSASGFASANRSQLTQYVNYLNGRTTNVSGAAVPHIEIYGKTEKNINTMGTYVGVSQAPADAKSVAFLDRFDHWVIPCSNDRVIHIYRFYWKIRLIE